MANLTILRSYALQNPADLPRSVLFSHSQKTMTIFDAYPKSIFHFLVLPRVLSLQTSSSPVNPPSGDPSSQSVLQTPSELATPPPSVADLSSLQTLLNSKSVSKGQAKEVILSLQEDALRVKAEIEQEMERRYGFKWEVWIGFHAVPSMAHMHLHVLSADLCSEKLKVRKHYNSFHPKLGFFLHIDEVLSWFDAEPSYYSNMAKLSRTTYESLLKESLVCFRCNAERKNMPILKSHLQEEWEMFKRCVETSKKRRLEFDESQKLSSAGNADKDDAAHSLQKLKPDDHD